MTRIPTVVIATESGNVIINQVDYDPAKHQLAVDITNAAPALEPAVPELPIEAQIPTIPATDGQNPVLPVVPPVVEELGKIPDLFVTKDGKKFIATDKEGKPFEHADLADGYKTEADAWAAIGKLKGFA